MIYKFKNHEIEVYDSIQNLPILRFQRFNKYQMIASEIGNDFYDYEKRTEKALQFLKSGMIEEAKQELNNRRQAVWNAFNEFSPLGKAFAVLVKRIDDVKYEEYTPDDLDRIMLHLNNIGLDIETSLKQLKEVKKKIETELLVYFPKSFQKNGNKEQSALRFKLANIKLDEIIENKTIEKDTLEKEILEHEKPNSWNVWDKENMERTMEVDFQKFGSIIIEKSGQALSEMTTFTFYVNVELIKERNPKK